MDDLRIGVVGTGAIGRMHIKRITEQLKGGRVVAVSDVNLDSAGQAADGVGARVVADGHDLIASPDVDAVLVASWDPSHKDYVLASLEQGKHVFCEKPLALDSQSCKQIVDKEMAGGKRLVQVGFMRRYDAGYRQIRQAVRDGSIGRPLIVHCAHRNPAMGEDYEDSYMVTQCLIHEIDLLQWLLEDEYSQVRILYPAKTSLIGDKYRDPQIALIETKRGVCIDVELFVNCQFAYDIRCEVVGETGAVSLPEPPYLQTRKAFMQGSRLCDGWESRFAEAYNTEIQEWINAVRAGKAAGPSSWDGYMASVTADAMLRSGKEQAYCPVEMPERPAFYAHD